MFSHPGSAASAGVSSQSFNNDPGSFGSQPQAKPQVVEIRTNFPDTWMFDTFDFNST
jgi:hypothetical protein